MRRLLFSLRRPMRPSLRLRRATAVVTPTATIAEGVPSTTTATKTSTINSVTRVAPGTTTARTQAGVADRVAEAVAITTTATGAAATITIKEAGVHTKEVIITREAAMLIKADIIKISSKIFIIILRL